MKLDLLDTNNPNNYNYNAYNNKKETKLAQFQNQEQEQHKKIQQEEEEVEATEGTGEGNAMAPHLFAYIQRKVSRLQKEADATDNEQQQQVEIDATQEAQQQECGIDDIFNKGPIDYIILSDISLIANNTTIVIPVPNTGVHPANVNTGEKIAQRQRINPPSIKNQNQTGTSNSNIVGLQKGIQTST